MQSVNSVILTKIFFSFFFFCLQWIVGSEEADRNNATKVPAWNLTGDIMWHTHCKFQVISDICYLICQELLNCHWMSVFMVFIFWISYIHIYRISSGSGEYNKEVCIVQEERHINCIISDVPRSAHTSKCAHQTTWCLSWSCYIIIFLWLSEYSCPHIHNDTTALNHPLIYLKWSYVVPTL